jgi:hypothetical protein
MERNCVRALVVAGLVLAQLSTPGSSYNLGIPITPGTRVPEDSPTTRLTAPQTYSPSSLSTPSLGNPGLGTTPTVPNGNTGPAYSFGAAPPPMVSPAR